MRHCLKSMGRITRRCLAIVILIAFGSTLHAQGIRMTVQQVWSGLDQGRPNPYYADIDNSGVNTSGLLTTSDMGSKESIEYPVELPSGSKKRILFLSGSYSDGRVILRTSSGSKEATIRGSYGPEQTRFGLISDNKSDLIFLKNQGGGSGEQSPERSGIGVGGCSPEDAPDRSFGYGCLDALVLGDGTEKLREDQIRAIKLYVQSGGTLVFVGGAAQSAAHDARWKSLLPVANPSVVTRNGLTELVGNSKKGSIFSKVAKGTLLGRSFGAGIVSLVSINPFESPMRESEDRRSIMMKATRWNNKQAFREIVDQQIGHQSTDNDPYSPRAYPVSSTGPMGTFSTSSYRNDGSNDPFQIKPPSLENIMWILIAYAFTVVPLNFLVLKKLKRMELAWVTTPIISILFSMILLNSTIGLYSASSTTRTTSLAIIGEGSDPALVFGKSEMFFPHAKSNDLKLSEVESILSDNRYDRSESSGLNLQDNGRQIIAPDVQTANLAFKEMSYIQTSSDLKGLSIKLVTRNGKDSVEITNNSKVVLSDIVLYGPGTSQRLETPITAGHSLVRPIDKLVRSKANPKNQESLDGWQLIGSKSPNKIVVVGKVDSMVVGPQYGSLHAGSKYMVVSFPQWSEAI